MGGLTARVLESRSRIGLGLLVLVLFVGHAATWWRLGFVEQLENTAYDQRLRWTMPLGLDKRVVIVDIDEKSLTAEGRWPWGRDKLARLVQALFEDYRIGLLGFDVVFAEPDTSSGLVRLEAMAAAEFKGDSGFRAKLEQLRPQLDYDDLFARTLTRYPVVLGYYFNFPAREEAASARIGLLPPPTFVKGTFAGKNIAFRRAEGFGANLESLQSRAVGAGHFNPVPDPDGVVRRVPMLIEYDGAYYGSLSLEMARQVQAESREVRPEFGEPLFGGRAYPGLEWLHVGKARVPVDRSVQALVPYRGPRGSFAYLSATDVLERRVDKSQLEGAVVLVGTTAPGLLDLRATPVGEAYPGVEVHANLIAGILDGSIKQLPEYTLGAEVVMLLVFGLAMAVLVPLLAPLPATLASGALAGGFLLLNLATWTWGNLALPMASGLLMLALMFVLNMSYGYFVETRGKRQLTGLFGHYVPPELVDEMAHDPDSYSLAAESRELTVLFSDVRGFTSISEGLKPRELSELMNEFLTPMTRVIHENRGTIDKYMGDAIMAFWGAPLGDEEHARHALRAAIDMQASLLALNARFADRGWPTMQIGIGINTGPMSVGNMGSEFRVAYTVLGDAVNLGSRLEALTKVYGVTILVSETTRAATPEFVYREVDRVRVKGKEQPVRIFEPIGLRGELDAKWQDELAHHAEALKSYRARDWDGAEIGFLNLARTSRAPGLYKLYVARIGELRRQSPGPDWDGVYTFTQK